MKTKAWILTEEYNDYDQHGEYFVGFFINKPTTEQIKNLLGCSDVYAEHILNGGGRYECEDHWYNLRLEEEDI